MTNQTLNHFFRRDNAAFLIATASAIFLALFPVVLVATASPAGTGIVVLLCAAGQSIASIFAGVSWSKRQAEREANEKWLPLAASAGEKLIVVMGSIRKLRASVSEACGSARSNYPELNSEKNRPIRNHFSSLCESNANRLLDVECHLENGLADWERFIKNNCSGSECASIGRSMLNLRAKFIPAEPAVSTCGSTSDSSKTNAALPPKLAELEPEDEISLTVSGVSTFPTLNGTWALKELAPNAWEGGPYRLTKGELGCTLYEVNNEESFFWKAGRVFVQGQYERCNICGYDGTAFIRVVENALRISNGEQVVPAGRLLDNTYLMFLKMDPHVDHLVNCHKLGIDKFVDALHESTTASELAGMLNIACPDAVSEIAIRTFNVLREYQSLPPLLFEPELFEKLKVSQTERERPDAAA